MTSSAKVWFCLAVAIIAASIADPLLEAASNAGLFGASNFTDHSNWDVVPAILVGLVFVALHCYARVRNRIDALQARRHWLAIKDDAVERNVGRLVPFVFAIQIAVLYLMETSEQFAVYGHVLGGTIWLGAPVVVSFIAHACACIALSFLAARVLRAIAETAVDVVRILCALAMPRARGTRALLIAADFDARYRRFCVLGRIGERAPPILAA